MFRFANPEYLYLLLLVPAFLVLYVGLKIQKGRALKRYGNMELLQQLMPELSKFRLSIKYWLLVMAIGVLVFVIAGPQFGSKLETVKREGVELMICLDVSNSMMSQDVTPSRLDKAKQILTRLINEMNNDKIGLIVFAGEAFTQLPITSDYTSAKMFLATINPGLVPQQGTAIGAAINLGVRSFTPDESSSKAIIVITDGENHEDDAVGAAKRAEEKGIKVSVIGVGDPKGAPIPVGLSTNEYRKDKEGNVVITKLNEEMCRQIAQAGAGMYVRADNTNSALKTVAAEVKKMSKGEVESKVYSDYDERFQALAWIVLILLLLEFCVLEKKNRLFRNVRLFTEKRATAVALLIMGSVAFGAQAQKAERSHVRSGNRLYEKAMNDSTEAGQKQLAAAEIEYRKALEVNQRSVPATFNLANTLFKQQRGDQAVEQYNIVLANTADKDVQAAALHNIGNTAMSGQQYDKAVEAYKQSLRLNPKEDETRYNLAVAQKMLEQQQQQQQDQNQDKDKEQDKQDDKDQQQQKENQQEQQKDEQNNQPPPQEEKDQMSKENAQQILDAFLQDEKATQEKVKKQQMQPQKQAERDW